MIPPIVMRRFTYKKINAFSTGESGGNPAACLYLNNDQTLSDAEMLSIAKEHQGFVSEVVYCTQLNETSFGLRYYSSECEVEFCGHGTIACVYELIKCNPELKRLPEISIVTRKGKLKVYNELDKLDAVFITAPDPEFLQVPVDIGTIAFHLDITPQQINTDLPVNLIDAGLRTLIVPIRGNKDVLGISPNQSELKDFCSSNGIDIILVFTFDVTDTDNKVRTRVFAPRFGYLEDPATGSGNSALGYYMLTHHLWDGTPAAIEQNNQTVNFNVIKIKTAGHQVLFGGSAVTKIEGYYII